MQNGKWSLSLQPRGSGPEAGRRLKVQDMVASCRVGRDSLPPSLRVKGDGGKQVLPAVAWGLGHAHCKPKVEERANSASLLAEPSRPLTLTRSATALSQ